MWQKLESSDLLELLFTRPINKNKLLPLKIIFDPNSYSSVHNMQVEINFLIEKSWSAEIYLNDKLARDLGNLGLNNITFYPLDKVLESLGTIVILGSKSIISNEVLAVLRKINQPGLKIIGTKSLINIEFGFEVKKFIILNQTSLFQVLKDFRINYLTDLNNLNVKERYLNEITKIFPDITIALSVSEMVSVINNGELTYSTVQQKTDLSALILKTGYLLQDPHLQIKDFSKVLTLANLL